MTNLQKQPKIPPKMPWIKVGNVKEYIVVPDKKTGKDSQKPIQYTYKDIEYDLEGWANGQKFLPEDFDLVHMRLKREKTVPGWISGSSWFGLRLKSDDVVVRWKRMHDGDGSC